METHLIHNPIIPGNFPDPSICRVGDDFYLINSSFEEYPGIPVFHSKDLANWELIGHAMTKENGFEVDSTQGGGGVMAPTIRYNNGTFYIINDNVSHRGNYIVTAKNPAGPWSEPHFLLDVPDIDTSLFFDDDDKVYLIGVYGKNGHPCGIWAQEIDIENFRSVGERHHIWDSAMYPCIDSESPHIYKKDGWYYLLIAEGGTGFYHSASVARAKNIFDWYEGNPANPIITHRDLGLNASITNIGHADFVDLPDGSWYAVMLGSRSYNGYKPYGRETFICPMIWENGWPVLSPGNGKMQFTYPAPASLPWTPYVSAPARDDFDGSSLRSVWTFLGVPYQDFCKVEDSQLKLKCLPRAIDRKPFPIKKIYSESADPIRDDCISAVLQHQISPEYTLTTKMKFKAHNDETAGLFVGASLRSHMRVELFQYKGQQFLSCKSFSVFSNSKYFESEVRAKVIYNEMARVPWNDDYVIIRLVQKSRRYAFYYGTSETDLKVLYETDSEEFMTFGGIIYGLFASANGKESDNEACFDYFTCEKE